jgi:hypothetical protein
LVAHAHEFIIKPAQLQIESLALRRSKTIKPKIPAAPRELNGKNSPKRCSVDRR